jgi:hypothetical protein
VVKSVPGSWFSTLFGCLSVRTATLPESMLSLKHLTEVASLHGDTFRGLSGASFREVFVLRKLSPDAIRRRSRCCNLKVRILLA